MMLFCVVCSVVVGMGFWWLIECWVWVCVLWVLVFICWCFVGMVVNVNKEEI